MPRTAPAKTEAVHLGPDAHPGQVGGVVSSLVEARKYSLVQAAKLAGVSESMMRNEVRNGRIPVLRIGVRALIVEGDLEAYLRERHGVAVRHQPAKKPVGLPDHVRSSKHLDFGGAAA